MRKTFALFVFVLTTSVFINANVLDDLIIKKKPAINQIVIELLQGGLTEQTDNSNAQLGKEICLAGDISASTCNFYAGSIGKGICLAGDGSTSTCNFYAGSIGKGICIAGGVSPSTCDYSAKSVRAGIEMIPFKDRTYWWDRFRDQYGNYQWRCRGGQTKQFADNSKCSVVTKDDERWPE